MDGDTATQFEIDEDSELDESLRGFPKRLLTFVLG
jgi:hypothetical protein